MLFKVILFCWLLTAGFYCNRDLTILRRRLAIIAKKFERMRQWIFQRRSFVSLSLDHKIRNSCTTVCSFYVDSHFGVPVRTKAGVS